jgi:CheY-specific phosphatase CheX
MTAAISEVMETMFFTIVETGEAPPEEWHFLCQSSISLTSSEHRLELIFKATESFARSITANLLAQGEDEVSPEQMEDTLKEVANMIGGNFVARVEEADLRLGIPRFESLSGESPRTAEDSLVVYADGEPSGLVLLESRGAADKIV